MTASDAGRTPKEEDTMGTHTGECIYEQRLRQATQRADTLATRLEQEQTAGNRLVEFVTGVQAQRDEALAECERLRERLVEALLDRGGRRAA
jgi:hypothetical protein